MASQQTALTKKRGPKPTGQGRVIGVRMHPDQLASLDKWIETQRDKPQRPEAIRRLVAAALSDLALSSPFHNDPDSVSVKGVP